MVIRTAKVVFSKIFHQVGNRSQKSTLSSTCIAEIQRGEIMKRRDERQKQLGQANYAIVGGTRLTVSSSYDISVHGSLRAHVGKCHAEIIAAQWACTTGFDPLLY